ncbi:DUF2934 domain-containing protein [Bosea sp. RAF48]|uniref:DUF2934 domain-containing protein n=1 Tax=Bosea sp. RAF48 TaxID=3237480 RepID=UPI003F91CE84
MSREQIVRDTAYAIWEAEGKPEGRDAEHWRRAEERVAASVGEAAKAKKPVEGEFSATTDDKPKATVPVKKAVRGNAGARKSAPRAKT